MVTGPQEREDSADAHQVPRPQKPNKAGDQGSDYYRRRYGDQPKGFSRIAIAVGAPVRVERTLRLADAATSAQLQQQMEQALHLQYQRARDALR